jgi:secondary thiamine-phosphate synthase enzyme
MIITRKIQLQSEGSGDITDITSQVEQVLADSNLTSGSVTAFVTGSTAGVTTIEFEPGLVADFKEAWERIAPENIDYKHNNAWGDGNGHSHIRASLLGPSLVVPFTNKKMALGQWQQIVLVDFDIRERTRQIVVQVMGE